MEADRFRRTRVAAAVGGAVLVLAAGHALGSAFALQEQSGSGLGNAFAGGARRRQDVSTIFYNPAGLVRLATTQVGGCRQPDLSSSKFSATARSQPCSKPLGGTGGAGSCAEVPNLTRRPFTDKCLRDASTRPSA
jgi:long-chain fatty acid transport protein